MAYQAGISPSDFWTMPFYDVGRMIEAWWADHTLWQSYIRRHASLVMSTQVARKDQKKVKPHNIWPLPVDESNYDLSEEAIREGREDFKQRIERLKRNNVIQN